MPHRTDPRSRFVSALRRGPSTYGQVWLLALIVGVLGALLDPLGVKLLNNWVGWFHHQPGSLGFAVYMGMLTFIAVGLGGSASLRRRTRAAE